MVLRGSVHRRRLCKSKEMRYRIRRSEACGKGTAPTRDYGGKQTEIRADAIWDNLVTYNLEVGDVKNAAEIDTKNTAI